LLENHVKHRDDEGAEADAAIMPAKTGVPTARRLAMPAPSAMTSGNRPKIKAKLVIITGRNRSRAPSIVRLQEVARDVDAFQGTGTEIAGVMMPSP
jgi:hypothetical protein